MIETKQLIYDDGNPFYPETNLEAIQMTDSPGVTTESIELTLEDGSKQTLEVLTKMPNYFYIENAYDGENEITLTKDNLEYSSDLKIWKNGEKGSPTKLLLLHKNDKIYLRGTGRTQFISNSTQQPFNIGGDITTLLNKVGNVLEFTNNDNNIFNGIFRRMSIIDASKLILPTIKLAPYCYSNMFNGCRLLIKAPKLPATTLAEYCYGNMFYGCTLLTQAPELHATTLAQNCYELMFYDCKSLTTAPELPATTLAASCYAGMFMNCTSLVTAPVLPATKLAPYCYAGLSMFSLKGMFCGCKSLNKVTALFTDNSAAGCLDNWLNGVSPTGTFIYNSTISKEMLNSSQIPEGWTKEPYKN